MASSQNPNSNDISDAQTQLGGNLPNASVKTLPIRGEKRILPVPVDPNVLSAAFQEEWSKSGQKSPQQRGYKGGRTNLVEQSDFYVHASMKPYVDYVTIRILNRGQDANGNADSSTSAVYRFLINPAQVQINRQTLDAQAFARDGWQFGVWGEDSISITLNGKTAGQYWAFGITDKYQEFTQSYRNLEQLQVVFENNGYWFEGEKAGEGPLAANWARRRIKMHQDVELMVGNFIWYGMFESLELSQDAEEPWLVSFDLAFTAWKERFRSTSPYQNQLTNDLQRGNSYSAYAKSITPEGFLATAPITSRPFPSLPAVGLAPQTTPNVNPNTPSVGVCTEYSDFPSVGPNVQDFTPMAVPGTNVTLLNVGNK
jgi:hypothetical protein